MYIFSVALMFSGYYMDDAFGLNLFSSFTYDALDELVNKNNIDETLSADLIFGDFIAGVRVTFGIITGDTINGAMYALPGYNDTWNILTRFLFTVSSAALWVYIVVGRIL